VIEQKFGHMVTYWPPNMESVPIIDAIKLDTVCPECSAVQAARALGVSFGDDFRELPFRPAESGGAKQAGNGEKPAARPAKAKAAK
jgi:6-phosphofructokinase 1